jgi:hypothetical protein
LTALKRFSKLGTHKGVRQNGSQETQEDQAVKESSESDEKRAARKNQQVRQIKTATKIAARCRGASCRDTFINLKIQAKRRPAAGLTKSCQAPLGR